eukprot:8218580-Karenia_brevis.AAC.1
MAALLALQPPVWCFAVLAHFVPGDECPSVLNQPGNCCSTHLMVRTIFRIGLIDMIFGEILYRSYYALHLLHSLLSEAIASGFSD